MATRDLVHTGIAILCEALIMELSDTLKKKRRRRRFWTRHWILKRNKFGASNILLTELATEDPRSFQNHLRMTEQQFNYLLAKVSPIIQKQDTNMREALPAALKLQVVLRFLATGDSFSSLEALYRIPKCSISNFLSEVLDAVCEALKEFMRVPKTEDDWKNIQRDFLNRWNFPFCCGAMDGKHVLIRNPPHGGSDFFNYKKSYSVVLLALVDANYLFKYIDVGTNGRMNDATIFANSSFKAGLVSNTLQLPEKAIFVADDAFPLRTNLLKPYSRCGTLTQKQKIFNYRLSRARRVSENAFGIMVARFRIYEKPIAVSLDKTDKIIKTCTIHNWLRMTSNGNYVPRGFLDTENFETGVIEHGSWRSNIAESQGIEDISTPMSSNNYTKTAKEIRDRFADYFVGTGAVSWQINMIH